MKDIREALSAVRAIRHQLTRGALFMGYGPLTVSATGVIALLVATWQMSVLGTVKYDVETFLLTWIGVALSSVLLIAVETVCRVRRIHVEAATEMLHVALEQFLPALVAGLLVTVAIWRYSIENIWMLPGLWQILFSMGVFASSRFLPRPMFAVGIWYLITGMTCLSCCSGESVLSPWVMGVPFGLGQLFVAGVLRYGYRKAHVNP